VVLILPAGAAKWERYVHKGKGSGVDHPEPHPLSYFTRNPSLNDAGGVCNTCPSKKQRTEVRLVGKVHGFKIYDVFYYFTRRWINPPPGNAELHDERLEWKAILVRAGPNQYREIWRSEKTQGDIFPSFLFQVGNETLLGLVDECYRLYCEKQNWWVTKDGVLRIDISPIWKAAGEVLPEGHVIYDEFNGRKHFAAGQTQVRMLKVKKSGPYRLAKGAITVNFTLERGQITVTGVKYDPNGNPLGDDDDDEEPGG
jgi:hypothetical protein